MKSDWRLDKQYTCLSSVIKIQTEKSLSKPTNFCILNAKKTVVNLRYYQVQLFDA